MPEHAAGVSSSAPTVPSSLFESEDDEIVAELPVYLSAALFPNLSLFEYPLNTKPLLPPSWARDRNKGISLRVKEEVGRIEVEVPVSAQEDFWRDERARDLGFTQVVGEDDGIVGGTTKKKKEAKKLEKWGDKMRLRSEVVPPATTAGCVAGVVHDGALHLHPVSRQMQLRTSLQYLDDADRANRKPRPEDAEEERKRAAPPPKLPPGKKLPDEEENDGSGSIKDFRKKMQTTEAKEGADPWIQYTWNEGDSDKVKKAAGHLITPVDKRGSLECLTKPLDYLNKAHRGEV